MTYEHSGWPARFPGECEECGERFHEGTPIRWIDPSDGTVAHVRCPEEPIEFRGEKKDACPECHVIHTGDCW